MKGRKHCNVTTGQILLCAPFGKDAEILTEIVSSEELSLTHCATLKELAHRFSDHTDFIVLTEEALVSSSLQAIQKTLRKQEPWSDIPIILLASAGARPSPWTTEFVSKLADDANISILERPVRVPTIISVLRTAKRARNRQRQVQGLLLQEKESASKLRTARDQLEQRVQERTSELSHTNRELNREIKERNRAEEGLRTLAAKVLKIQDDERRRIARDLHDGVGQTLASALMALAEARSAVATLPAGEPALRQAEDLLQHGIREVRTVSHLLHPPLLDESGLMSAIRWYAEEFSKRSRIAVTLELYGAEDRLTQEIKTAVFRIVQEALTNVYRHAKAQIAQVELKSDDLYLQLRIKDNGHGISPSVERPTATNGKTGVGLASIRERATLLGGTFAIQSGSEGTTLSVSIPIPEVSRIASCTRR
ncbi:MAG TPA: sensor histidine kinase [Terriglobales bacterium]|nr:sensor histidine kinase [Terriglobales bacterium]